MNGYTGIERRTRRRFAIQLDMRCTLEDTRQVLVGTTCDISSFGVRFLLNRNLPEGQRVELSLTWPVRLDAHCPLQLVVQGLVIRSDAHGIAIVANRHEFRLLPAGILGEAAPGSRWGQHMAL